MDFDEKLRRLKERRTAGSDESIEMDGDFHMSNWKEEEMKFSSISASEFKKAKEQAAPALESIMPVYTNW